MIGQTVSHYRILEKLGEGGMGVVYKAEDTKLKRTVALKFLPPDLTRDKDAKQRFIHEAQAASALQHNNICTIHEIDETKDGQLFISMDCYDGETLKQKTARDPLPVGEAIDAVIQAAEGLSKAHEAGMVHRDIKPANVVITRDGTVKILDFGLAKLAGMTKVTRAGTTVGTVWYMSPEQAKGEQVDARSDIFSLGAVLYEMLTREVPFPGEHEAAVMYGIMYTDPKPLAELRRGVPEGLQEIIDRALKKDPKERYQDVLELRDELEAVSAEFGGDRTGHRRRATRARGARRDVHMRRIFAAGAVVAVLAVLGSVLLPRLWRPAPVKATHALAVMDFRDFSTPDDPTVSAGITELVSIGLIEADVVRVVSSDLLHDLRRRLFGSPRGVIEESQTMEIARKAGATLFLTGTIRQSDEGKLVTWHLVDAQSGDDVKAGRMEGSDLAPLADQMIAETLPLIVRRCGVEATKAPTAVENVTTESPRAYQHYMAGVLAAEEYRKDDAIAEFKQALVQDSTFALAYLWLARMHWSTTSYADHEQAMAYADKAWALRSRLGIKDRMQLESLRYDLDDRVGDAIVTLREILKRWPDDLETLRALQNALYFRWYFAEAAEVGAEGPNLYPDDVVLGGPVYLVSLAEMGRVDEALRANQSYVKQHSKEPNGWDELGWRYLALGQPDSAEAAFHKAVELDPDWLPENASYCAYHRGDLKGAIKGLEELLEDKTLGPERRRELTIRGGAGLNLAALYTEAGRFQKAGEVCREYIVPPNNRVCRLLLAIGRAEEVLDMVHEWTRQGATRVSYHYSVELSGLALVALGDVKGARGAAKKLLDSEFEWGGRAPWQAHNIEAEAALVEHNPKAALEELKLMKRYGIPFGGFEDIDYRTVLAAAYRMDGRLDKAAEVHEEMLRIYGGHALSHYELGQIYEEIKRPADAKREYARFLEMWSEADDGLPQLVDARKRFTAL